MCIDIDRPMGVESKPEEERKRRSIQSRLPRLKRKRVEITKQCGEASMVRLGLNALSLSSCLLTDSRMNSTAGGSAMKSHFCAVSRAPDPHSPSAEAKVSDSRSLFASGALE